MQESRLSPGDRVLILYALASGLARLCRKESRQCLTGGYCVRSALPFQVAWLTNKILKSISLVCILVRWNQNEASLLCTSSEQSCISLDFTDFR